MLTHTYSDPEGNTWRVKILRDSIHRSVECQHEDGKIVFIQDNRLEPIEKITGTFLHRDGSIKPCRFIRDISDEVIQVAYVDGSGNKLRGTIGRGDFRRDGKG